MSRVEVTDYTTVEAEDWLTLEQQVKEMLNDGWQPLGGGFLGTARVRNVFDQQVRVPVLCQTMVLRGKRRKANG